MCDASTQCCKFLDTPLKKAVVTVGTAALVAAALYKISQCCGNNKKTHKKLDAVVFSGPSGVGKGTLIGKLRNKYPSTFAFSVSHTSRAPRAGEVDGKDYHFSTKEKMQKMVDNNEFLECCNVHGNFYGTSKAALKAVADSGKIAIIEMDVQGAQKLRVQQGDLNFHYIFIHASITELEKRLVGRGTDNAEKIKVRLETARQENDFIENNPNFYDRVIENDTLDRTLAELEEILKAQGVSL